MDRVVQEGNEFFRDKVEVEHESIIFVIKRSRFDV